MKKVIKLFILAIFATLITSSAYAESVFGDYFKEKGVDIEVTGSVDYYDRYVWRGQYLDEGDVVQPGITVSANGFEVGYWGSMDLNKEDTADSDESDVWVAYTVEMEKVSLTVGHTWYQFPGSSPSTSTREFYVSASADLSLSPTLSFYHDYEDGGDFGNGNYYALDLSHTFDVLPEYGMTLDVGGTLGYVDEQWLDGSGTHVTLTAGLNIPVSESFTVTPIIGYNIPMGDLEDEDIGAYEEEFFGGVSMAYTM